MMLIILWFSATIITGCNKQIHNPEMDSNELLPTAVDQDCDGDYQTLQNRKPCLRLALSQAFGDIDPGLARDTSQAEIVEQLFLGLTDFQRQADGSYHVVGELATDWQSTENNTVYTFNLRHDVSWVKCENKEKEKCISWRSEEPVTAHDIVWAIRRNLLVNQDAPLGYINNAITILEYLKQNQIQTENFLKTGNISSENGILSLGVHAIDDYKVEFILEQAYTNFPSLVSVAAYRPLPRHVIEKYKNQWTELDNIQTNSSYVLAEWQKGNDIILEKNPHYYDANHVNILKVHYYIIPETELGLTLYKNNALDILGGSYLELPMAEIYHIKTDPLLAVDLKKGPQACTAWYGINTQRPPTNNRLIREALAAAIDKQLLIDTIIQENNPAKTLVHPSSIDSIDPKVNVGISFALEQANTKLKEYKKAHLHQKIPPIVLAYDRNDDISKITRGVQTLLTYYLKGIDFQVKAIDASIYDEQIIPLQPETTPHLFWFNLCSDYFDPYNWLGLFHSQQGLNWLSGDKSVLFDKILDEAYQMDDPNERQKKYRQAEQILIQEEIAVIPLYFNYANILVKPYIVGWYNMPIGGQHIRDWALEKSIDR
ncbi:MAG: peptide ABC transporter substrate-binding protein [Thioploca sp.]|nr:peptide ABC transporter substrate-binding protein [Thioploca sp.]